MLVNNLKAYVAQIGMTIPQFCEIIGYHPNYLRNIINGKKFAGKKLAKEVFQITNGIVKLPTKESEKAKENELKEQERRRQFDELKKDYF